MDQKRILWIIVASGLFLLVVVGVALYLSAPQTQNHQSLDSLQLSGNTWIKGEVKNPEPINTQLVQNTEVSKPVDLETQENSENKETTITVDTVTLISKNTNVYTQDGENISQPQQSTAPEKTTIIVNTVAKDSVTTADTAKKAVVVANEGTKTSKTSSTTTETKKAVEKEPAKAATTTTSAASSKKATATVTETQPIADQFWVQVASFTGKKNAEDARAALLEEKINSEIFTFKNNDNVVYYRLRVGPYTTKSEAEYWHSRIKLIPQFEGTSSYVVNSTGKAQN